MWLCGLANIEQRNNTYWELAKVLYFTDFKWFVPNDDNRAFEGKNLRERFCDEVGIEYIVDNFPEEVSMLELIIALAYRWENIIDDKSMDEWFWKMLENAGLDKYTDEFLYAVGDVGFEEIDQILEKIINRTYRRDGRGGLFPLQRAKKDQRKVELWYQMNTYLVENYYGEDAVM